MCSFNFIWPPFSFPPLSAGLCYLGLLFQLTAPAKSWDATELTRGDQQQQQLELCERLKLDYEARAHLSLVALTWLAPKRELTPVLPNPSNESRPAANIWRWRGARR